LLYLAAVETVEQRKQTQVEEAVALFLVLLM
jgi:hypothetical protein